LEEQALTFKDRYNSETTWDGKVAVMEIYHLAMSQRVKGWTLTRTAEHFDCSIGLVSENLRLASAIHIDPKILHCESRQVALKRLNRR